jgi:rhodanese-related sulfurtransferase
VEEKKKNSLALTIGFFLILLVAVFTYYKNYKTPVVSPEATAEDADAKKTEELIKKYGISPQTLSDKIKNKEKIFILDMRTPTEFEAERLIDSENISPNEFSAKINSLSESSIYVLLDDGQTNDAFNLIAMLAQQKEYKNIFFLNGGFSGWKNEFGKTISSGDPESATDQAKVKYVSSDDLKKMLEIEKDLMIIDVRKPASFADGHIKNAVNIFLDDIEKRKSEIPVWRKIVFCDSDGLWAFKASVRLFDLGYTNTYVLSDGLNTWKSKGYEIVK